MTVKQLIIHLLECDPHAEVMVEGKAWTGAPGQSDLMSGGSWPVLHVECGTFPYDDGPSQNWTKIVGTDAWIQNHPIVGEHLT